MRSFRSDPYLWIHLAGVAALPIFLELCFLGLAAGNPFLPVGLELLLIAAIGIAPVLWMQWQRPFCIFSLLLVALKPRQLTEEQRKLLRLFKTQENRAIAILVPIILVWTLWQLYRFAPIAAEITPFQSHGVGLLVAAIAFLASNLFFQVPASVIPVLFTSQSKFAAIEPYPVEKIPQDFSLLGIPVARILPKLIATESAYKRASEKTDERLRAVEGAIATAPEPTTTASNLTVTPSNVEAAEAMKPEVEAYAAPSAGASSPIEPLESDQWPDQEPEDTSPSLSIESLEPTTTIDTEASALTIEVVAKPVEPTEFVEPIESVELIEPVEPTELIEPVESVELLNSSTSSAPEDESENYLDSDDSIAVPHPTEPDISNPDTSDNSDIGNPNGTDIDLTTEPPSSSDLSSESFPKSEEPKPEASTDLLSTD